ncbi:DUF2867 domain-containing protein [Planctomycetota bacterium]|nr:DUF2867 domain-containing protein [Planctomycetota bacterium]
MKVIKHHKYPSQSIISQNMIGNIHYMDSFSIQIPKAESVSVDYLNALIFSSVPQWIRVLMAIRNCLVKPFGLETGNIPLPKEVDPSIRFVEGESPIFFTVLLRNENEIVMAEKDKHLNFRASTLKVKNTDGSVTLYLTTIVHFNNIWGRLYFLPVKPFHKLIIKSILKRLPVTLDKIKR